MIDIWDSGTDLYPDEYHPLQLKPASEIAGLIERAGTSGYRAGKTLMMEDHEVMAMWLPVGSYYRDIVEYNWHPFSD